MICVRACDDQAAHPGERIAVEREGADGHWTISNEVVLPEMVHRVDARRVRCEDSVMLGDDEIAWVCRVVASVHAAADQAISIEAARFEAIAAAALRLARMTPGQLRARHARLTAEIERTTDSIMHRSAALDGDEVRAALRKLGEERFAIDHEVAARNVATTNRLQTAAERADDIGEQARARIVELESLLQAVTRERDEAREEVALFVADRAYLKVNR